MSIQIQQHGASDPLVINGPAEYVERRGRAVYSEVSGTLVWWIDGNDVGRAKSKRAEGKPASPLLAVAVGK